MRFEKVLVVKPMRRFVIVRCCVKVLMAQEVRKRLAVGSILRELLNVAVRR